VKKRRPSGVENIAVLAACGVVPGMRVNTDVDVWIRESDHLII
jgi:hypothetical protein